MVHINPTSKIKAKTLEQLKALEDNEFIDQNYYLKPTDSPAPRFLVIQICISQEFLYVLLFHIVALNCTILTNI